MRWYIDEYLEPPERQRLVYNYDSIKDRVLKAHNDGHTTDEIVKDLQDWLYIFTDKQETEWETSVVNNMIKGIPIINRFTKEIFGQ